MANDILLSFVFGDDTIVDEVRASGLKAFARGSGMLSQIVRILDSSGRLPQVDAPNSDFSLFEQTGFGRDFLEPKGALHTEIAS